MSNVYVWSDLHLGHKNIANFRPLLGLSSEEQHHLLYDSLAALNKRDTCYLLGDVCFDEYWLQKIAGVRCRTILICGNHDLNERSHKRDITMRDLVNSYDEVYSLYKYKGFWLSHAPIHPMELRGNGNIHGHCVDELTEILTQDGWKNHNEISTKDLVYNYNPTRDVWELDNINDVIKIDNYHGRVFEFKGKGISMRVTDAHKVVFSTKHRKFVEEPAHQAFAREKLIFTKSFQFNGPGINLSDKNLKIMILLAADGSITKYGLARVRLSKKRKISRVEDLLNEGIKIPYSKNVDKLGMTTINFRLPEELKDFNIKGLDKKLVKCNRKQAEIIKETYSWTDGNKDTIFTSKKEEVDILQHLFVKNGFACKVYSREGHGFSTKPSYQLSVTDKTTQLCTKVSSRVIESYVDSELFWCISTSNGNFMARRGGSAFLTGNCHPYWMLNSAGNVDNRYISVCVEYAGDRPLLFNDAISLDYWKHCVKRHEELKDRRD